MRCQSVLNALAADGGGGGGGNDGGGGGGGGDGGVAAKGSVAITFNCTGDACGKMGSIIARVKVCGAGGAVNKSETLAAQTLTMGTPIMMNIADVDAGDFCLRTYVDVNGNNMQDTGDVVPATDEMMINVPAGGMATATIDFTMLKP